MSTAASDGVFLSALQPNSSVTTYGLPSNLRLGNGGSASDEASRAQRVQQQVQMRLAEKSTLPRQNGSAAHYAMSDYGGSSTMKYPQTSFTPSFSSKSSFGYSSSRTMVSPAESTASHGEKLQPIRSRITWREKQQRSLGSDISSLPSKFLPNLESGDRGPVMHQRPGFSCQSAGPDVAQYHKIYQESMRMGHYQGSMRPQNQIEHEPVPMPAIGQYNPWMADGSDAGSMVSDRDAVFNRQYSQSTVSGYAGSMRQGGAVTSFPMRRSLSGTLSRTAGLGGGEVEMVHQQSFKGPAHRTISRITRRNQMGSVAGMDGSFIASGLPPGTQGSLSMQRQGTLSRAMSVKSMHSVGRGRDVSELMEMGAGMGNLNGITSLDMPSAVQYLSDSDPEMQVLGAAYIQHECYNDSDAKVAVRRLKGIRELVKLFNSDSQEVQRFATGATRNLIFENMDNKVELIEEGGIPQLIEALRENDDDELRKNITGILWNLSSKDNLKQKLARETLPELTEKILIPFSQREADNQLSPSEGEIFYNTTGCLSTCRNLSSVNENTRQQMRQMHGLVDALVNYIKASLDDNKTEDKGVENSLCILRNLSYQLYNEIPPSALVRLNGQTRDQSSGKGEAIGCFTPQSKKTKNSNSQDISTFTEVARVPKGMEWLWHPQIMGVYNSVLRQCEINSTAREAAAGALQNITAGDKRWASVLSRVALEQERMLPVILDLLRTNNDLELRSLTGFLRNMSRHAKDKNDMSTKVVNTLVSKLPADGNQKEPSSEVVVNICGVLNNLVTSSYLAARDISFFDGLPKLVGIKESHDNSSGKVKAAKAASTVLCNMFQYKKLHKTYKAKGFMRRDFEDISF
uniref:Plakophilin 3a n=1 Tax=Tetraodon nigroviridis TaxID=99883 RepID=H3D838_TETNG